MRRVVIVGAAGLVGSRVTRRLAQRNDILLTAIDIQPIPTLEAHSSRTDLADGRVADGRVADGGVADGRVADGRVADGRVTEGSAEASGAVTAVVADVTSPRAQAFFADADVVIHLATRFDADRDGTDPSGLDLAITESILESAATHDVNKIIIMSSAMVYGARPSNPIPITEAAPVDPDPDSAFATAKVAVERAAAAWASDGCGRTLVVFRPTTALGEGQSSWVARTLRASAGLAGDYEPPLQFVHLDDLAEAVVLAATSDLDGIYNVAPDGWIDGYEVRQLVGTAPRVRLPLPVAAQVAAAGWRNRIAATPPGILSYTQFPWVVANDRIRAAGWTPTRSSAEAYVESVPARPWAMVNARQRQKLATGAAVAILAVVAALAVWLVRWVRQSR